MSKRLVAALLLLIVSGSGAVFTWYAGAAEAEPSADQLIIEASSQADADIVATSEPVATDPTVTPSPTSPSPTSTPEPVTPPPGPTVFIPADLPSAADDELDPTAVPDESPPEPTETPQWSVATPARWAPTRLTIPDIEVDSRVVGVALTDTGEMEAPADYEEIGWYRLGAKPGEPGRAVLAGHVDSRTGPAVFYRLRELQPGAIVEVSLGPGVESLQYVVREIARYPENDAPLERIFGPADVSELILITCTGDFDFSRDAYPDRLVVYADLIPATS
jgi:sortase (surface protein transpeptidase)